MANNMMLSIAAIILLTVFTLSANRMILQHKALNSETEYTITAIGLAESVINEAKTRAFDENVVSSSVSTRNLLTSKNSLGADAGETFSLPDAFNSNTFLSFSKFDDVDDYNGYTRKVDTPRADGYQVSVTVDYVNETDPESVISSQTYCKKMTVSVTSPYITIPVRLSYVFTY